MKFSESEFSISASYDAELRRKATVFESKTATRKAVRTIMITSYGLAKNEWANNIMNQVVMDDLFAE